LNVVTALECVVVQYCASYNLVFSFVLYALLL